MTTIFEQLSVLAEPIRVRLLRLLLREELGVGECAQVLQLPQSTVSRHLKVLREAGWVQRRSVGPGSRLRVEPGILPEDARALWEVVDSQVGGEHAEDDRRLEAVLAARQVDAREFFGRHAEQWDALRRELFGDGYVLPTLLALLPSEWVVVDLGCGTGEVIEALAPHVAQVIGVDREEAMLRAARARLGGQVDLRLGGLEDLPLAAGEADAGLCMLVLHHVEDLQAAGREIRRVLAPGGRLVVLDMVEHQRDAYRVGLGHAHLGFSRATLEGWAEGVDLELLAYRALGPEPEARGPGLFLAVLRAPLDPA